MEGNTKAMGVLWIIYGVLPILSCQTPGGMEGVDEGGVMTWIIHENCFMRCALHLRQAWLVNNPRSPELFMKIAVTPAK